jgi:transposase
MRGCQTLPLLSDDELGLLFWHDAPAMSRYRVMYDIVVERREQRCVALRHGISERTVRLIVSRYRREGLSGLRSQSRSAVTTAPNTMRAREVLVALLAEQPDVSGGDLWTRAQPVLQAEGAIVSRRTAYRILSSLRSRPTGQPQDALKRMLRGALSLLIEEPPLALGRCALAHQVFPEIVETRRRGECLRQALSAAIETLRPPESCASADRRWWPYQVMSGEYLDGESRTLLQRRMAISASTYARVKRHALRQIAEALPDLCRPPNAAMPHLRSTLSQAAEILERHDDQDTRELAATLTLLAEALAHAPAPYHLLPPVEGGASDARHETSAGSASAHS